MTNEDRCKIARFNSVNSQIIGWKFTKFGYNVAQKLPFNALKEDLRSANPLLNTEVMKKVVLGDVCDQSVCDSVVFRIRSVLQ